MKNMWCSFEVNRTGAWAALALAVVFGCLSPTALPAQEPDATAVAAEGPEAAAPAEGGETPAPEPTPEPDPDAPIDFNLKNANIDSVVHFLTQHTGKPVMRNKAVQAQLTISAPEKIPPYQALDLIYDSLRLEGFVVIETEDLLQIIPADQAKNFDIMTFVDPLPELVARQKGRIIRKIIPLANVRAAAMKERLDPFLGKHASITADERTNKLLVTDTVRNIERYERILTELDIVGFDNMDVRIVELQHADAAVLTEILKETILKAMPATRPGGDRAPEGTVVVMHDVRTNALVVAAPIERMNTLVDFIQRLDVPKPREIGVHVVEIKYAEAQSIATSITDIFRRRTVGRSLMETIEVRATGRGNALLVLASEENLQTVLDVVHALDTEEMQKRETRKFELKHLDAEDTAKELAKLYGDVQSQRNPWMFFGGGRSEMEVKFVPLTRTNMILAIAPPSEFKLIESLVTEIDRPIEVDEILPKFYHLKYAKAADVEKILNGVFSIPQTTRNYWDYWYGSSTEEKSGVGRLTGKMKFVADESTNSIIAITNNAANYPVVDRMIERIDKSHPELANTMIISLKHANAERLSQTLNTLFGKPAAEKAENENPQFAYWWGAQERREDARPISNLIDQVRFVPDPRTNSVLVTTASQNFEVIRGFIQDLDRDEPQALIRVRIMEVKRNKDKRLGLRWTPGAGTYSPEDLENSIRIMQGLDFVDTFGGTNLPGTTTSVSTTSMTGRTLGATVDGSRGVLGTSVNLDLLFQMLLKNLDSEIVISPILYVSNNEKGRIFVGENIPRLKDSQLTSEGTRNDSFENQDIGIDMTITPNINREGVVVLNVQLSTSQTTGETRFGSDILQKREYNTKVAVRDGETMVLGGIRLVTKQETVRKWPILGDIPLLGQLFRNRVVVDDMSDLYAFITPEVIANDEEARKVTEGIEASVGRADKPE